MATVKFKQFPIPQWQASVRRSRKSSASFHTGVQPAAASNIFSGVSGKAGMLVIIEVKW